MRRKDWEDKKNSDFVISINYIFMQAKGGATMNYRMTLGGSGGQFCVLDSH